MNLVERAAAEYSFRDQAAKQRPAHDEFLILRRLAVLTREVNAIKAAVAAPKG